MRAFPSKRRLGSFSSSLRSSRAARRIFERIRATRQISRLLRRPYSPASWTKRRMIFYNISKIIETIPSIRHQDELMCKDDGGRYNCKVMKDNNREHWLVISTTATPSTQSGSCRNQLYNSRLAVVPWGPGMFVNIFSSLYKRLSRTLPRHFFILRETTNFAMPKDDQITKTCTATTV